MKIERLLIAKGKDFVTSDVSALPLELAGITGDFHYGFTRKSGGREPWYPRGTEMRNDRQVTLVSVEDLAEIAKQLQLPQIDPSWIGANILVSGIEGFTRLPMGKKLFSLGGATLNITGENKPCRIAGAEIAKNFPERAGLDVAFAQEARQLRGVIAAIDRAGILQLGETLKLV